MKIDFDGDGDDAAGAAARGGARGARDRGGGASSAPSDPALSKLTDRADWAAWLPAAPAQLRSDGLVVERQQKRARKSIDVGRHLDGVRRIDGDEAASLRAALDWPDGGVVVGFRLRLDPNGGAKPGEVIEALTGAAPPEGTRYARLALWALRDGGLVEPMALEALRAAPVAAVPAAEGAVVAGDPDGAALSGTDVVFPVAADAGAGN